MKNKTLNICMALAGIALLAVFIWSARSDGQAKVMDSKKVSSIADIVVPEVPNVTTDRPSGVITAEEWASYYPEIYASYMKNAENYAAKGERTEYTETNPDIQVLYQGMAFSKDYGEAIGHNYTLDDIAATTRPHKLANCLTCKTPDFTATVNSMGVGAYKVDFEEMYATVSEPVSCYNCHANTPGTMVITHDYMANAMGGEIEANRVSASVVSCAQCHIEYYFDPDTKATTAPYVITVAEQILVPACGLVGPFHVAVQKLLGDFSGKTGRRADQTLRVLGQDLVVDSGPIIETLQISDAVELHKVVVALVVHGQKDEVIIMGPRFP